MPKAPTAAPWSPIGAVPARCPKALYDEYAERGESENRNKELKCELCADRLSDHRYLANCFRMFLHCLADNLLVSLRQAIAAPPANEPTTAADYPAPNTVTPEELPSEARTGWARRRDFNRRREADPLGEGHACTWRMRLIKVAARSKSRHVASVCSCPVRGRSSTTSAT